MQGFGDKYEFAFQRRRETDQLKEAQVNKIKFEAGRLTLNEWRELDGEEPLLGFPAADMPFVLNANGVLLTKDGEGFIALQQKAPGGTESGDGTEQDNPPRARAKQNETQKAGGPTGAHVSGGSLSLRSKVAQHRSEVALRKTFQELKHHAHAALAKAKKVRKDNQAAKEDLDNAFWSKLLAELHDAWQTDWQSLVPEMRASLEEAASSGVAQGIIGLGVDSGSLLTNAQHISAEYAAKRSAEMVGMKYDHNGTLVLNPHAEWNIAETTRNDIREIISDAIANNRSLADVKAAIAKALEEEQIFSEARANMIARTEIAHAQMNGTWEVWKRTGMVTKIRWEAMGPDPCPECLLNDQKVVEFGHPFPSGAHNTTESHPHCLCIVRVVAVLEPRG
jgi:hypothetical protein